MKDLRIGGFEVSVTLLRKTIDYEKLREIVHILVDNLNQIVDINFTLFQKQSQVI